MEKQKAAAKSAAPAKKVDGAAGKAKTAAKAKAVLRVELWGAAKKKLIWQTCCQDE